jgi:hypothetical protein
VRSLEGVSKARILRVVQIRIASASTWMGDAGLLRPMEGQCKITAAEVGSRNLKKCITCGGSQSVYFRPACRNSRSFG